MRYVPGAYGRRHGRLLIPAVLVCTAGGLLPGAARAEVKRLIPEQRTLSTLSKPGLMTFLYTPGAAGVPADATASPIIFFSGEWGWTPLHQDVASHLAAKGRFVLGIESPNYFTELIPADRIAGDFEKFRSFVNDRAGRPPKGPVSLAGFSAGAEIIPYFVNEARLTALKGMVLLAPDTMGSKVFRVSIQLKIQPREGEGFDVEAELRRMPPLPVVFMEGSLDDRSEAKKLAATVRGPHKYALVTGGDHQFKEVRDSLFPLLLEAFQWIDGEPPPAPAPAVPGKPKPAVP